MNLVEMVVLVVVHIVQEPQMLVQETLHQHLLHKETIQVKVVVNVQLVVAAQVLLVVTVELAVVLVVLVSRLPLLDQQQILRVLVI